jgi:hypothetical protein
MLGSPLAREARSSSMLDFARTISASVPLDIIQWDDLDEKSGKFHRQAPPMITRAVQSAACIISEEKEWNIVVLRKIMQMMINEVG